MCPKSDQTFLLHDLEPERTTETTEKPIWGFQKGGFHILYENWHAVEWEFCVVDSVEDKTIAPTQALSTIYWEFSLLK